MSWYSFRPYVSVAERRKQAAQTAKKMAKQGQTLSPVQPAGRAVAKSFWGLAWCKNLESYSDFANRLPRGRTYLRNGSVIDLQIAPGLVTALVQGSSLYKIRIQIDSLPAERWNTFCSACAGQISSVLDLLQGRLSKSVLEAMTRPVEGLFPSTRQIKRSCSCPDSASLCKHLAAVIYGIGTRLDEKPDLFFTLRSVDMNELISAATVTATAPDSSVSSDDSLEGEDLSALFGVEIANAVSEIPKAEAGPKLTKKAQGVRVAKVVRKQTPHATAKPVDNAVGKPNRGAKPSAAKKSAVAKTSGKVTAEKTRKGGKGGKGGKARASGNAIKA